MPGADAIIGEIEQGLSRAGEGEFAAGREMAGGGHRARAGGKDLCRGEISLMVNPAANTGVTLMRRAAADRPARI